jgi:hypothetical protein
MIIFSAVHKGLYGEDVSLYGWSLTIIIVDNGSSK